MMVSAPKILVKNKKYVLVMIAIFACQSAFITFTGLGFGSDSNLHSILELRPDDRSVHNVTDTEMVDERADDYSNRDVSGYGLAARVRARCASLTRSSPLEGEDASMIKYMIPVPQVRSLYCPVEKWARPFGGVLST
ncbi:hypothetical protein DPMN_077521 [Dreissena polymorpha]|uniref:Uncharacterized protein n=1 Tax=Dreissena polymorpha TaxID=45954 RepID=A0A9D4BPE8_DREPO|nr:hypothetical protein DPMN_077521 [Dreissena polymorpha]